MSASDTINAPFNLFLDDFEASVPARWSPALRWHYLRLLAYLWKHGAVADDDYEIAVKSGLKPVGNYVKTTSKLREKLSFHPEKQGFLTQGRIHKDRLEYLENRAGTRKRVAAHRHRKRVTPEPVTRPSSSTTATPSANITPPAGESAQARPAPQEEPPPNPKASSPPGDLLAIPEYLDRRRGSRLPEDWILPPTWRRWAEDRARQAGVTLDIDTCALTFRNHWLGKTGQGATKRDWFATWQNWIIKDIDHAKSRKADRRGAPSRVDASRDSLLRYAEDEGLLDGGPEEAGGGLDAQVSGEPSAQRWLV